MSVIIKPAHETPTNEPKCAWLKVVQGPYIGTEEWPIPILEAMQYEYSPSIPLQPFDTNDFFISNFQR